MFVKSYLYETYLFLTNYLQVLVEEAIVQTHMTWFPQEPFALSINPRIWDSLMKANLDRLS